MPFIIAVIGALAAFYFFVLRARNAANVAGELSDMANDVRLAARRFGFRRRTDLHPVESIEDPKLAAAAIAMAFMELDDYPSQQHRDELRLQLQMVYGVSGEEADEMLVLGRWFINECGGPTPGISRLSRKLYKLDAAGSFEPLLTIVKATLAKTDGGLNSFQTDALDDVKRAFRIR